MFLNFEIGGYLLSLRTTSKFSIEGSSTTYVFNDFIQLTAFGPWSSENTQIMSTLIIATNNIGASPSGEGSEGFYFEGANGRFRRYYQANDGSKTRRGWRLSISQGKTNSAEDDVQKLIRFAFIAFLFLSGLLGGLSLSALYEGFTVRSPGDFIVQYSTRASETRRYFFIGITLCCTGSLCLGEGFCEISDVIKGKTTRLSGVAKSNIGLVVIYFSALVVTLLCSRVDVRISTIATQLQNTNSGVVPSSVVEEWRGFAVPRSILCILGWLVSCYRFVVTRSNSQHVE